MIERYERFTADRDGWYRLGPDRWEYLGPGYPPDNLTNVAEVQTTPTERRIYQNSGANLSLASGQVIPNATWTRITFDTVERCWFDAGLCACDHRPGCIPDREERT